MFSNNFYPTPESLIEKMVDNILPLELSSYSSILEPSAGKGNIVDYLVNRYTKNRWSFPDFRDYSVYKSRIDTIELSSELRSTLKGKGYRVVHDDFLTFESHKKYDLIIMNPPFDQGDKHLLKAIEMQKRGGKIICILNAETLKNPYSNTRKDLLNQLESYKADVEYLQSEFTTAEKKTNVEVALIKIDIPTNRKDSLIFETLKNDKARSQFTWNDKNQIITADPLESAIQNYNLEMEAGLKLIYNYFDLIPLISRELSNESTPILALGLTGQTIYASDMSIVNKYIEEVRFKYWSGLINIGRFNQLLTSNLRDELRSKLQELKNYEFSKYNIQEVLNELMFNMEEALHDTIMELFDDLTYRYTYNDYSGNIHLYDGWKTNKGYKINDKKVIIPLDGYGDWGGGNIYFPTSTENKIRDMQKSLEYLDNGKTEGFDNIKEILNKAKAENNDLVEFKYFKIKFYKKGTGHIYWKDKDLVKKLNIFGGKDKGWLPNDYGEFNYNEASSEHREIIDSFEGELSYNSTYKNKDYYLSGVKINNLMLVDSGSSI